ncbi:hypothetical protein [Aeromonas sp. QDB02]|uniref:hypothetical protein n=1 Tax=Aeromonas sp. QDB02 TaxID=2990476 RepID=UPI0022DF1367|nr:hypothetical protein [Aeromonas sp. QDB02]
MACPSQQNGNQFLERPIIQSGFQLSSFLGGNGHRGPLGLLNEAIPITPPAKDAQAASL